MNFSVSLKHILISFVFSTHSSELESKHEDLFSDLETDMTANETDEDSKSTSLSNRRAVYCRRCQVHGVQNLLRGHKDKCAFKGCWCAECRIIVQSVPSKA